MRAERLVCCASLALTLACAPIVEVPSVTAYGGANQGQLFPTDDEAELLDALDEALVRAGKARAVRDPALLLATRLRCNLMSERQGEAPSAVDVAQALHRAGVWDERYAYLDSPVGYATRSVGAEALDGLATSVKDVPGELRSGACRLDDGANSRRYFALTLVAREVSLGALPHQVEFGAPVAISGKLLVPARDAELLVVDPAGQLATVPAGADGALAHTVASPVQGRYVIEVVAREDGYLRRLASAAFWVGPPPGPVGAIGPASPAFPPIVADPLDTGSGDAVAKALAGAVEHLRAERRIAGGSPGEKEAAFAAAEAQLRARLEPGKEPGKEPERASTALAERRKGAGIDGAYDVIAGRVAAADVRLLVGLLRESPMVARALARAGSRIGVAAHRVPKTDEFEYAIVVTAP